VKIETVELAGLRTRIIGPENASDAKVTVVLLHGFGAPGDDLVPLGQYMGVPAARFVFPAAPIELGGLYGDSRAWWRLDLMQLESDLRTGNIRDRRNEVPDGLVPVRTQVSALLEEVKSRYSIGDPQLVLGGFSQGAMVALDVALHRDTPPAGVALMSGTLLAESEWSARMPRLAGVPIVQSLGRADSLLPFSSAELLRDKLVAAGAKVEFVAFDGGHEIPPPVLAAVGELVAAV
jgi:phospholipase/carboxylesterase